MSPSNNSVITMVVLKSKGVFEGRKQLRVPFWSKRHMLTTSNIDEHHRLSNLGQQELLHRNHHINSVIIDTFTWDLVRVVHADYETIHFY